jgi:hypothetical protein
MSPGYCLKEPVGDVIDILQCQAISAWEHFNCHPLVGLPRSLPTLTLAVLSRRSTHNVLGKRAGQASEPVKILHILHLTTHYTSNIEDMETKQIALSFTYPNSMFARTTLAISK